METFVTSPYAINVMPVNRLTDKIQKACLQQAFPDRLFSRPEGKPQAYRQVLSPRN